MPIACPYPIGKATSRPIPGAASNVAAAGNYN